MTRCEITREWTHKKSSWKLQSAMEKRALTNPNPIWASKHNIFCKDSHMRKYTRFKAVLEYKKSNSHAGSPPHSSPKCMGDDRREESGENMDHFYIITSYNAKHLGMNTHRNTQKIWKHAKMASLIGQNSWSPQLGNQWYYM